MAPKPKQTQREQQREKQQQERVAVAPKINPVEPDHDAARSAEVLMMTADFLATRCLDNPSHQGVTIPARTAWRLAEVLLGVTHALLDEQAQYPDKLRALGAGLLRKFTERDSDAERDAE